MITATVNFLSSAFAAPAMAKAAQIAAAATETPRFEIVVIDGFLLRKGGDAPRSLRRN